MPGTEAACLSRILVSTQSRHTTDGGRGDAPLTSAYILLPRLGCCLPVCLLVAFALHGQVSVYCCLSAGDERGDPAPVQLTCPVCAVSELPDVLGSMLALVCVLQEVGSFSIPFLLVPCHHDSHLQHQCLNTFLEGFPASCWDELGQRFSAETLQWAQILGPHLKGSWVMVSGVLLLWVVSE